MTPPMATRGTPVGGFVTICVSGKSGVLAVCARVQHLGDRDSPSLSKFSRICPATSGLFDLSIERTLRIKFRGQPFTSDFVILTALPSPCLCSSFDSSMNGAGSASLVGCLRYTRYTGDFCSSLYRSAVPCSVIFWRSASSMFYVCGIDASECDRHELDLALSPDCSASD